MSTNVIYHTGKKGRAGRDGFDGLGVSDIRYSLVASPIINLFRANNLDSTISWTRDSEAEFIDRYNRYTKKSGDNVTHLIANSEDYSATPSSFAWSDPDGVWALNSNQAEPDPLGGNNASEISFSSTTSQNFGFLGNISVSVGDIFRVSIYVKVISGTLNKISFKQGGAGGVVDFPQTPSGSWQRFNVVYTGATSSEARFLFDAPSGCVVHVFGVNATKGTKLYDYETIGDARPQTFALSEPVYRENQNGYLIEGAKTNLCLYSQDLTQWETSGAPVINANPSNDIFGDSNQNTLVSFGANPSITIFQDISISANVTYAVSFFAVAVSGQPETLSVSLGGGTPVTAEVTSDYIKQTYFLKAGSNGQISFSSTSAFSSTSFILGYIQVETGTASSYIPTVATSETRQPDIVSYPSDALPNPSSGITFILSYRSLNFSTSSIGYAFNTLENDFGVYFNKVGDVNTVYIRTNTGSVVTLSDINSDGEVIVTYDGTTTTVYCDGVLSASSTGATWFNISQSVMYLGASDASQTSPLNAYVKALKFWPFAATENEVKFISDYYTGNRYSDLG